MWFLNWAESSKSSSGSYYSPLHDADYDAQKCSVLPTDAKQRYVGVESTRQMWVWFLVGGGGGGGALVGGIPRKCF